MSRGCCCVCVRIARFFVERAAHYLNTQTKNGASKTEKEITSGDGERDHPLLCGLDSRALSVSLCVLVRSARSFGDVILSNDRRDLPFLLRHHGGLTWKPRNTHLCTLCLFSLWDVHVHNHCDTTSKNNAACLTRRTRPCHIFRNPP